MASAKAKQLNREIALLKQIIHSLEKYQALAHGLDASVDLDRYREFLQETIAGTGSAPKPGQRSAG